MKKTQMKKTGLAVLVMVGLVWASGVAGSTLPPEVEELPPHALLLWKSVGFLLGQPQTSELGRGRGITIGSVSLEEAPGFPLRLRIGQAVHLVAGDFNLDGHVDLAVTAFAVSGEDGISRTGLWILIAEEPGRFGEPLLLHEDVLEGGPAFMAAAAEDLDNDGWLDFVLIDIANIGLWIMLGDGSGGLREKVFVEVPGLVAPSDLAILDLDGDGERDLVVAGLLAVHVLWGTKDGGYLPAIAADYSVDGDAYRLVVGDFDEDGLGDLAVLVVDATVNPPEYWIDILSNAGERRFSRGSRMAIEGPGDWVFALAAGDLDGDGHLDLVTSKGGCLYVLLGSGTGSFVLDSSRFILDPFVPMIALGDLSTDGCLNIIVLGTTIDRVLITRECYTEHRPRVMSMTGFSYPSPRACSLVDVNGDGIPDLVVAGSEWERSDSWTVISVLLSRRR